jgi:hypothetical protein
LTYFLFFSFFSFQHQSVALDDLDRNITTRINEVQARIYSLSESVIEYQIANYLTNTECHAAALDNAEVFHYWNQHIPLLNTYLSNESKIHYSVYLSAQLLGLIEELDAQKDVKQILQVTN